MAQLRIVIVGAGNIGGTLGTKWLQAGHRVTFGVLDVNGKSAQAIRARLADKAVVKTIAEALPDGDVVVFAIPGAAVEGTVAAHAPALAGKLVIDATNHMGSAAPNSHAAFAQQVPSARYTRAFNIYGAENFANPLYGGVQADLFYIGPEADTAILDQLISEIGMRPLRLGDVQQIGTLDALLTLWFTLAHQQGFGRHLAFKALTR
jgi:8-hydroxy-5-deazaflavin:NADPH oxidoreductase